MRRTRVVSKSLAALLLAYAAAAIVLGLVPVNRGFVPAPGGTVVFLRTNGVHAEVVLPLATRAADLRAALPAPPEGMRDIATHVAIGWGDRAVYLEARTWADLHFKTGFLALLGLNGAALHVEFGSDPVTGDGMLPIALSDEALRRLADAVLASFVRDTRGAPILIPGAGYGKADAFYEARGRYTPFHTCNEWARSVLAQAGVRMPVWSPSDRALFLQARRAVAAVPNSRSTAD